MSRYRAGHSRAGLLLIVAMLLAPGLLAQSRDEVSGLRERLRARYDILALQDGVGLVPRQRAAGIRVIEIRNGAVFIDGRELTGRELRERLGEADADLVLRASYLDAADQRALAAPTAPPPPAAAPPEPPEPPEVEAVPAPSGLPSTSRGSRRGDVVRVGGDVQVGRDEFVDGDVAAIMGSATVDGEVRGDIAVVMGSLTLGPTAVVHGDVSVVGGTMTRAPGARVDGKVSNVGIGPFRRGAIPAIAVPFAWRVGSLAATLVRTAFMVLLALIVVAIGGSWVERIADHAAAEPWHAGLIGFFAEILTVPLLVLTIVVLAVSIIGIPLLLLVPFAILFVGIVALVGFTGVAYQVGRLLNARAGWVDRSPYMTVIGGVFLIVALTVLARSAAIVGGGFLGIPLAALGYLIEYLAWTIGFGSAIQVWLRRRRATPPPLPA